MPGQVRRAAKVLPDDYVRIGGESEGHLPLGVVFDRDGNRRLCESASGVSDDLLHGLEDLLRCLAPNLSSPRAISLRSARHQWKRVDIFSQRRLRKRVEENRHLLIQVSTELREQLLGSLRERPPLL